jgi:hypothetical protein
MSGPYSITDLQWGNGEPRICPDPETCTNLHNEEDRNGDCHEYGCECNWCMYVYWTLK